MKICFKQEQKPIVIPLTIKVKKLSPYPTKQAPLIIAPSSPDSNSQPAKHKNASSALIENYKLGDRNLMKILIMLKNMNLQGSRNSR